MIGRLKLGAAVGRPLSELMNPISSESGGRHNDSHNNPVLRQEPSRYTA